MNRFVWILLLLGVLAFVWWRAAPHLGDMIFGPQTSNESEAGTEEPDPEKVSVTPHPKPEFAPEPEPEPDRPDPKKTVEEQIAEIVAERYAEPDFPTFEEIEASWNGQIPEAALPNRVRVAERLTLRETSESGVLAISVIQAGGEARPVRVSGSQLTIASLAQPALEAEIAIAKTDLPAALERRYEEYCEAVRKRLASLRKQATKRLGEVQRPDKAFGQGPWHDPDDEVFARFKEEIAAGKAGAVGLEHAKHFFDPGFLYFETGPLEGRSFPAITVFFEVPGPFGPMPHESYAAITSRTEIVWMNRVPVSPAQ